MKLSSLVFLLATSTVSATGCDEDDYQSFDGTCNNIRDPTRGAVGAIYKRGNEGAEFLNDTINDRANARVVSNVVGDDTGLVDPIPHNLLAVFFGQFLNHDLENNFESGDLAFVPVPTDPTDPICYFPPGVFRCATEDVKIQVRLSGGVTIDDQFEVTNLATSYLDLNQVYGINVTTANQLRSGIGGKMLTEDYNGTEILVAGPFSVPFSFNVTDLPPRWATTGLYPDTAIDQFGEQGVPTQGDPRAATNVGLFSMHILFLREHNRLADEIATAHPTWDDETVFQEARRFNIAQYQNIVMYEYAPDEFGSLADSIGQYRGYKKNRDATTLAVFATAAFRYGHSALVDYTPVDECGVPTVPVIPPFLTDGTVPQLGAMGGLFSPLIMTSIIGQYEHALRGLVGSVTAPIDTQYNDEIRNIASPAGGIDLLLLDIMRGRTNGIPNYAEIRQTYKRAPRRRIYQGNMCKRKLQNQPDVTDPLYCFLKVTAVDPDAPSTTETDLATKLQTLYSKVNKMDAMVGMLAEPPVPGSSLGETIGRIIIRQYKTARAADRFWFERTGRFTSAELAAIHGTTMKDILVRNMQGTVGPLPDRVFIAPPNYVQDLVDSCASSQ